MGKKTMRIMDDISGEIKRKFEFVLTFREVIYV